MSAALTAPPPSPRSAGALSVPLRLPARRYGHRRRLETLSVASIRAFEKCPEAFRRHHLLGEREPMTLSLVMGSVVGDAISHFFQARIEGGALDAGEVDDLVVELFDAKIEKAVLAPEEDAAAARAQCRAGAADYLEELAPGLEVISVERRAGFRFEEAQEWRFVCYFDLECPLELCDLKFGLSGVKEVRVARDLQATAQTFMRWAEGRPAIFSFHSGVRERPEEGPRWHAVPAPRTHAQLLGFRERVARVARQIVHLDRTEPGPWPLSSDLGWWCAPPAGGDGCAFWARCPVGAGKGLA
ncbi:MAG TPA: PD-(D/E)XK nuclease family protein [Solirubrobacterales bacterium]|nr:PD-(D/E)XK nuclease family protein [Solirubrobacterales bacterium]